jgi:hypothetical protein
MITLPTLKLIYLLINTFIAGRFSMSDLIKTKSDMIYMVSASLTLGLPLLIIFWLKEKFKL